MYTRNISVVQLLLEHGADINQTWEQESRGPKLGQRSKQKLTALDRLTQGSSKFHTELKACSPEEMKEFLISKGAKTAATLGAQNS